VGSQERKELHPALLLLYDTFWQGLSYDVGSLSYDPTHSYIPLDYFTNTCFPTFRFPAPSFSKKDMYEHKRYRVITIERSEFNHIGVTRCEITLHNFLLERSLEYHEHSVKI